MRSSERIGCISTRARTSGGSSGTGFSHALSASPIIPMSDSTAPKKSSESSRLERPMRVPTCVASNATRGP